MFITIALSLYNEAKALPFASQALFDELQQMNDERFEILFIDDGSTDESAQFIAQLQSPAEHIQIRYLALERNYGHEIAMLCAIDHALGDYLICMDADGQHPATSLPAIMQQLQRGQDIVLMQRSEHTTPNRFWTKAAYRIISLVGPQRVEANVSDFFGINATVRRHLQQEHRNRHRMLRAVLQRLPFERSIIEFEALSRPAGKSKYRWTDRYWMLFLGIFALKGVAYLKVSAIIAWLYLLGFVLLDVSLQWGAFLLLGASLLFGHMLYHMISDGPVDYQLKS